MQQIPIAVPSINEDDVSAVSAAVSSGWVSGRGRNIVEFEKEYSEWLGVKQTVTCSTGTSALHLALVSAGIGPGDEVVIPAFSMGAVAFAVSYTGAKIVLVDSELDSWNMDPMRLEEKITPKTKAIIAMHTYGHPVDMDPILEICARKGITLIEDAAEAHGSLYKGKRTATMGRIGCFSFFSNKIITTGEGGAVVTFDDQIAERARILRDMAFSKDASKKFLHEFVGFNYRMTNMQAALGRTQLKRINQFIEIRRSNAQIYNSRLRGMKGIIMPPEKEWAKSVYWMYSVLVQPQYGLTRDELMRELSTRGIETRPFFVPVHQQPVYARDFIGEKYPVAEELSATGLNLPSGNTLTAEQVQVVSNLVKSLSE